MKEIQSVQMWNNGQAIEATILNAYAVNVTLGTAATFSWGLLDDSKVVLTQGNLNMTGEDYTKWGANDSYAWEFIATTLNLTIIGDYVPPVPEPIVEAEAPTNSI
jgi:hypothetical protein